MEILAFDASGSTSSCENYWTAVLDLVKSNKYHALLSWSTRCKQVKNVLDNRQFGGTSPSSFMEFILQNLDKNYILKEFGKDLEVVLHITTDGQIDDSSIQLCAKYLQKPNFPRLKKVIVYYIGNESHMNFGLNAIFGSVADLHFSINDIKKLKSVPTVQELENYEDIFSEEFIAFLCSRVNELKTSNYDEFTRLRKNLIAKIEKKIKRDSQPISPKEYYDNDDARGLEKDIKERLFSANQTDAQTWKNKILKCFDKVSEISIADIRSRKDLESTVLTSETTADTEGYETCEKIEIEDSITFANIDEGKVCVLVKSNQAPLFKFDSKCSKNPFQIFQDETICSEIIKRFELHTLSVSSIKQLVQGNTITSPFTRDNCRAFILGPSNMNEINFNSQALATFFESEKGNEIYGDKLLWQLVMLYLIKTHVDSVVKKNEDVSWSRDELHNLLNVILKVYIMNEKLLYRVTLHVKLDLPVKRVPFYLALWYILRVAPFFASNTSRNLIRYPGVSCLLNLYDDLKLEDVIRMDTKTDERLRFKIKLWNLWNQMIDHRGDEELRLKCKTSYQNYCIVLGKVVLLSGARPAELPPLDLVSGLPYGIVKRMYNMLGSQSTRLQEINEDVRNLEVPEPVILPNDSSENHKIYHMQIDLKTLHPTEICPVTNKPWRECAGTFDTKSESYARIFSMYCEKYKKYPDNHEQLILLHNRKRAKDNVSSKYIANYMKHVFDIYQPVTKLMNRKEFVQKYNDY